MVIYQSIIPFLDLFIWLEYGQLPRHLFRLILHFDICWDIDRLYQKIILCQKREINQVTWDGFLFVRTQKVAGNRPALSERAYQNLVKTWVGYIGLNPELYGTHSLRRTRPAHIYKNTGNLRVCQVILGHASITNTQEYLGIEENEALEISRKFAF